LRRGLSSLLATDYVLDVDWPLCPYPDGVNFLFRIGGRTGCLLLESSIC